jgi:hypothetical protein
VIRFTEHAALRYCERVNPNLTTEQAQAMLPGLAEHGTVTEQQPGWVSPSLELDDPDAWLVVGEIAFALLVGREGLRAVTCIPRGFASAKIAKRRKDRRRKRTQARIVRGAGPNWRPPPSELAA